jgi:hypothetical protein
MSLWKSLDFRQFQKFVQKSTSLARLLSPQDVPTQLRNTHATTPVVDADRLVKPAEFPQDGVRSVGW